MQHFDPRVGIAAAFLGMTALSGCYPPPPTYPFAAGPPETYGPIALTPSAAPAYPPAFATPEYGPTTPLNAAPSGAGTTAATVAPYGPPPLRAEIAPPTPSPILVWQPGRWSWSGGQYVWMSGQYVQRPTPSANWIPGYWQQGPSGWRWVEGRWA